MQAWHYLQGRLSPESGDRAPQFYLVLRQTQALRALAVIQRHFWTLSKLDLPTVAETANRELADEILTDLLRSRTPDLPVDVSDKVKGGQAVGGYRFASTSDDRPKLAAHWAYHQGHVVTSVARCHWAGLVADPSQFFTKDEAETLTRWCLEVLPGENIDLVRVGLFAGWSLLHLDATSFREKGFEGMPCRGLHISGANPSDFSLLTPLAPDAKLLKSLRKALEGVIERALDQPLLLSDLHFAYFYRLNGADDAPDDDRYRQEHFVVPTAPIVLSLLGRLDNRLLLRKASEHLVANVAAAVLANPPKVVPQQPSGANGTVNMAYLHDALAEAHDALAEIASSGRFHRSIAVARQRRPTRAFYNAPWLTAAGGAGIGWLLSQLLG